VVGREFRGRKEVKKKTSTDKLNGLIFNWCIGGC
jgi:hypothetical protein